MTEPRRDAIGRTLATVAQGLLLAALAAAPWPYGCAEDAARYTLAAVVLLAGALSTAAGALRGEGLVTAYRPALALLGLGAAQVALGSSAAPAWTAEALLVWAAMLGVTLVWNERARARPAAAALARTAIGVCAAQAVFGAVQWSLGPDRIYGHAGAFVTTPFGSFVDHNHFAGFLEMGALLAFAMAAGEAQRDGGVSPRAVVLGGLGLGITAAHLASRSRGGLLALATALVLLVVLRGAVGRRGATPRGRVLAAASAVIALAFGLAVIPSATRSHLASLLGRPDASGSYRVDMARASLRLALAHPALGVGLGAYPDAIPALKPGHGEVRTTHAESDVLEFLAEGGLLGLGLLAWLAARLAEGFVDRLRHGRDPARTGIAVGAAAGCAALLVHSLVDFNLRIPSNALLFASLLGLASASRAEPRLWGGRTASGAAAVLMLALAAGAAWRATGARELARALAADDGPFRIAALDRALARHPLLAEGWRAKGVAEALAARGGPRLAEARLAAADRDLARALRLRPQWGEAWADRAWVEAARGQGAAARASIARARSLDPTHPGIEALARRLSEAAP